MHLLEKISETHWVVDSLLLNRDDLLIVEPKVLRRGNLSSNLTFDDMEVVNRSESVNVAASVYWEPLSNQEYTILLKSTGTLELLDGNLKKIDCLETGIEQGDQAKFIRVDERTERIFVNLEENAIYSVALQRTENRFTFKKNTGNPKRIHEAPCRICFFEATWHSDLEKERDFMTIASVLHGGPHSETLFEVIQQSQKDSRRKKQPWSSLINLTSLDLLEAFSQPDRNLDGVSLKTVPNTGFFLFSLKQTFFFTLSQGPQQYVEGSKTGRYVVFGELSISDLSEDIGDLIRFQPVVFLDQAAGYLEFKLFTNYPVVVSARMEIDSEDPEMYSISWRRLTSTCSTVAGIDTCSLIEKTAILNHRTVAFWIRSAGLELIDTPSLSRAQSLHFPQLSALFSAQVGCDLPSLVSCYALGGNYGKLVVNGEAYEDFFRSEVLLSSDKEIINFWLTKQGLWLEKKDGIMIRDGEAMGADRKILHVTSTGQLLKQDSSIWAVTDILNDKDGGYALLSNDAKIEWSDVAAPAQLPVEERDRIEPVTLACMKLPDSSLLTVVGLSDKVIVLRNDSVVTDRTLDLDSEISSISIAPAESERYIVLGTSGGMIIVFDLHSLCVAGSLRVGSRAIYLCSVPESPFIFAYSKDDLMILEIDEEFRVAKVLTDFRINVMRASSTYEIYVLSEGGQLSRLSMPKDLGIMKKSHQRVTTSSQCFTKFASFSSSSRLIVASTLSSSYSHSQARFLYSAHLVLYDIQSGQQLYSYDLSKKYPQASVSDIVAVPYTILPSIGTTPQKLPSYAERLTLERCFVVSLNYETADDDSLANLLLFSIDESNCSIDLHVTMNTMSSITSVSNYFDNSFAVAGEILQIFGISYLVHENAFRILPLSNPITLSGYPTKILGGLPRISVDSNQVIRFSNSNRDRRILISNLLQGLQEYEIKTDATNLTLSSSKSGKYTLGFIPGSERDFSFIGSTACRNRLMVDCAYALKSGILWFATAYSDCSIEIHCIEEEKDFDGDRKVCIKLESSITSVVSLLRRKVEAKQPKRFMVVGQTSLGKNELFSVTTARGDVFLLKEGDLFNRISEQKVAEEDTDSS